MTTMNMLQSLEAYTSAQKWVGTNFVVLGILLLVLAGVSAFLVPRTPMATGMKYGALVAGALIIIGGFSYRSFCDKTYNHGADIYQTSTTEFVKTEYSRMEKVDKGYLVYQIVFAAFIVAALLVVLFVNAPLMKGIAFAVAVLFIGIMIIEGFSHSSIRSYTEALQVEARE